MVILYKSDIIIYDYECYMKCMMYGDMANVVGCIDFIIQYDVFSCTSSKHEGLSLVAGGPVIMGNMVCNAYVLYLKCIMGWWCFSQTSF